MNDGGSKPARFLIWVLGVAGLMGAVAGGDAKAIDYDMATVTCGQITDNDPEDSDLYFSWIVGYLAAKSGVTKVDSEAFERNMKRVRKYCIDNPNAPLMKYIGTSLPKS